MEQAVQETGDSRHVAVYLLIYIEHFALLKIDLLSIEIAILIPTSSRRSFDVKSLR